MTNQQINKVWNCLAAILDQVEMLSYYGSLLEQRKLRLEKIEGRVLWIRDILKDEKKALGKKSGKSKLKIRDSLIAPDNRKGLIMTDGQIEKIRHCLTAILDRVEFMSCQGKLSEQRKKRLKEVKHQVLEIKHILRGSYGRYSKVVQPL
ncbi:unnamed protein product [marine sediment metagenome]|uniref:Uncharacterized protein n=1 Tax=marine sediment metagenome TaxID=412755 RepID=X1SAE4_9ZZZZ